MIVEEDAVVVMAAWSVSTYNPMSGFASIWVFMP